jgi:hypothetical protein
MDAWSAAPPISASDPIVLKNRKPNKVISVPPEFRRLSHTREHENLVNDIKISTGCIVILQGEQGRIYQFGIIGAGAGLEEAIQYINGWISNAHIKSKYAAAWVKMPAFDANKRYYEQGAEMEQRHKQRFKGPIPEAAEGEIRMSNVSPCSIEVTKSDSIKPLCHGQKPLSTRVFPPETSSVTS